MLTRTATANQTIKAIVPPEYRWTLRLWAGRAAHAGRRRYCPCCRSHVRRFGYFGDRPRPDRLCPVCGALERHRVAIMFLRARRGLLSKLRRVLHVAPEPPIARVLRQSAMESYVSIDLSDNGAMVQGDLTRLPFPPESFDCVYCSHVLEHVPDDATALAEVHRVLRPGGWAMVQVPIRGDATFEDPSITDPDVRRQLFGQPDHVRIYGRDFKHRLADAGFAVSVERPQRGLDRELVSRYGVETLEDLYLCTKPQ